MCLRKYLVTYLTLGYPNKDEFLRLVNIVNSLDIDFIEIGIPPRLAKYDGPVIRRSYEHVRRTLPEQHYLSLIKKTRGALSVPIIVLAYMDEYLGRLREFIEDLYYAGVDSILFPDLLIDYVDMYGEVEEITRSTKLGLTLFSSPSMPDKLIEKVAPNSRFFLYLGIRPATGIPIPVDPVRLVKRVRGIVRNKLVVGFGLSINDIPEVIKAGADGVAVGSMLIDAIDRGGVEEFIKLVRAIRGAIDGT